MADTGSYGNYLDYGDLFKELKSDLDKELSEVKEISIGPEEAGVECLIDKADTIKQEGCAHLITASDIIKLLSTEIMPEQHADLEKDRSELLARVKELTERIDAAKSRAEHMVGRQKALATQSEALIDRLVTARAVMGNGTALAIETQLGYISNTLAAHREAFPVDAAPADVPAPPQGESLTDVHQALGETAAAIGGLVDRVTRTIRDITGEAPAPPGVTSAPSAVMSPPQIGFRPRTPAGTPLRMVGLSKGRHG